MHFPAFALANSAQILYNDSVVEAVNARMWFCGESIPVFICTGNNRIDDAVVAQLVERHLAKVEVASPSLVYRSIFLPENPFSAWENVFDKRIANAVRFLFCTHSGHVPAS